MPPSTVYRPVSSTTSTEPIQKLSSVTGPIVKSQSGNSVGEHDAAGKDADRDLRDHVGHERNHREHRTRAAGENRRSRNSGIVKTLDRM